MLLPQEVPNIPGLEIDAFSRPAQIVGGDYFDFIDFSGGKPLADDTTIVICKIK